MSRRDGCPHGRTLTVRDRAEPDVPCVTPFCFFKAIEFAKKVVGTGIAEMGA
jgi:hypothetical protein